MSLEEGREQLLSFQPNLVAMETKAPILGELRREVQWGRDAMGGQWVLFGDVASAWPEHVLREVEGDWLIQGGDYDWALLGLVRHLDRGGPLPGGCWCWEGREIVAFREPEVLSCLDEAPWIDRNLTQWQHYGEAYLYAPATYMLSGRGCGGKGGEGGRCAFCSWQHALWNGTCRLRSPEDLVEEMVRLRDDLGVKEIFDDNESGLSWNPGWLEEFVVAAEKRKLPGTLYLSANARADHLTRETCALLKRAGFRLLKVGLESANDVTLQRIQKAESFQEIDAGIRRAKEEGFRVLMTMMVGYPWESVEEVKKTYLAARALLTYKTRFGDCLQASVLVPYPGTPLFEEGVQQGWFRISPEELHRFDMDQAVLSCSVDVSAWCRRFWGLHLHPAFVLKSLLSLRNMEDMRLAFRGVRSLMGHVRDYE